MTVFEIPNLVAHFVAPIFGITGSPLNAKLGTFNYAYDVKGNLTEISESGNVTGSGPRTRSYQLDIINRLTKVSDGSDPSQGSEVESYALDEEGNRITSDRSSFYLKHHAFMAIK